MISVEDLKKSYGGNPAVRGISFDVKQGETFGLLGPNGAGKSTTISMLIGALVPDSGTIRINGQTDPTQASVRYQIGAAPQSLSLYEELTAVENLTFFAKLYGLSGTHLKERVDWGLHFSGLKDRYNHRVRTFSGGMKRRLNMSIAAVHNPQVILFDEPTVGVDPQSRNHLFDCLEELKSQKKTILYTTHYMEEAQRLCDRIAVMDHGQILDIGTIEELIHRHGGSSRVSADLNCPIDESVTLPGELNGLCLQFKSETPLEEIGHLISAGVKFKTLQIESPSLETVFLSLTGRNLRD